MRSTIILAEQIKDALFVQGKESVQYHGDIEQLKRFLRFNGIEDRLDIVRVELSKDRCFHNISIRERTDVEKLVDKLFESWEMSRRGIPHVDSGVRDEVGGMGKSSQTDADRLRDFSKNEYMLSQFFLNRYRR